MTSKENSQENILKTSSYGRNNKHNQTNGINKQAQYILLNRILHNRQELHEGKRLSRNKENSYLLIGLEFISSSF